MRAAIAQAKRGEDINVDPFFDLMDPVKDQLPLSNFQDNPSLSPIRCWVCQCCGGATG